MPFKLSKADVSRREALVERLEKCSEQLAEAIGKANEEIERAVTAVNTHIAAYNEVLAEAREFTESVVAEMRGQYEEKSERWQDGDVGQKVSNWIDEWDNLELDDIDEVPFEPIEEPEDYTANLAEISTEP